MLPPSEIQPCRPMATWPRVTSISSAIIRSARKKRALSSRSEECTTPRQPSRRAEAWDLPSVGVPSSLKLIPIDGPLLALVRALRRGQAVAVAADRDITGSGIVVDFFDAPARLPDGHVQLALRTGAELLPMFALRHADSSPGVQVEPPLELERTGNFEQDVQVNVQKVVARMEDWIRRYPEQWPMFYPIWRDGEHGS